MRVHRWLAAVATLGPLLGCLGDSGVATVVKTVDYQTGKATLASRSGIDRQDQEDLAAGRLLEVARRYRQRPSASLTTDQLRLLCELQLRFSNVHAAHDCLDDLSRRLGSETADPTELAAVTGGRALLLLHQRQYDAVLGATDGRDDDWALYLRALALARSQRQDEARAIADRFARFSFEPEKVYLAASILSATGDWARALELATHPRTRLAWDYGLSPHEDAFGRTIEPAQFRFDPLAQFRLGLAGGFSYAPRANAYVEFLVAKAMAALGRDAEAAPRFDRVTADARRSGFHDLIWMSLAEGGLILERGGHDDGAVERYEAAIEMIESIRAAIASEAGRIGYIGDKFVVYDHLADRYASKGDLAAVVETVERAKSRALVDLLSEQESFAVASTDLLDDELVLDRIRVADLSLTLPPAAAAESFDLRLRGAAMARAEIRTSSPQLASLVAVPAMPFAELAATLASDETALLYHRFGDELWAIALDHHGVASERLDARTVARLVGAFRSEATTPAGDPLDQARALYDLLVRPFAHRLSGRALVVVPAGELHYLPFAALHDGNAYLVEGHTVRVLPSLTVLSLLNRAPARWSDAVAVVANPERDDPALALPGTEREAAAIVALRPATEVVRGRAATVAELLRLAGKPGTLHVASHAELDRADPMASRLLLAPAPGVSGDLTVAELLATRIERQLVILSACQTGLGAVSPGDDLIGLSRSLLHAGARGVVASLWRVEDEATAELMRHFYVGLGQGLAPAEALRDAQRAVLARHPAPFSWAAFQYTGVRDLTVGAPSS